MAKKKKQLSPLEKVAKRYKITAREARDITTAIGNVVDSAYQYAIQNYVNDHKGMRSSPKVIKKAAKDVVKQVKETGRAATTGKKGTTAGQVSELPGEFPYTYTKGQKRSKNKPWLN